MRETGTDGAACWRYGPVLTGDPLMGSWLWSQITATAS